MMNNTLDTVWEGPRCEICNMPQLAPGMCGQCRRAYAAGYDRGRRDVTEEANAR